MPDVTTRLSDDEVKQRLGSYKASAVTDELYGFGKMMIDEVVDRFKSLDAKASALAAYSRDERAFGYSDQEVCCRVV